MNSPVRQHTPGTKAILVSWSVVCSNIRAWVSAQQALSLPQTQALEGCEPVPSSAFPLRVLCALSRHLPLDKHTFSEQTTASVPRLPLSLHMPVSRPRTKGLVPQGASSWCTWRTLRNTPANPQCNKQWEWLTMPRRPHQGCHTACRTLARPMAIAQVHPNTAEACFK